MLYSTWRGRATCGSKVKEVICEVRKSQPCEKPTLCFCFAGPNSPLFPSVLNLPPVLSSKENILHPSMNLF